MPLSGQEANQAVTTALGTDIQAQYALHTWLRLQNHYDNELGQPDPSILTPAALQTILNIIKTFLVDIDGTAQNTGLPKLIPGQVKNRFPVGLTTKPLALDRINDVVDELNTNTRKDYAEQLLTDLSTYVTRHGLSAFNLSAEQAGQANQQLAAWNPVSIPNRGIDFALRGLAFSLLFPYSFLVAAGFGFVESWTNFLTKEPYDRPYGKRVIELMGRKDEKGRSFGDMFDYERQISFRGRNYSLKLNSIVNFILQIPASIIDATTAMVFEPIRYIFSYDSWEPKNKYLFDQTEKFIFNILFSPVSFTMGLLRAIGDTFTNLRNLWNCDNEQDIQAALDGPSPYGLAMLRGMKWMGKFSDDHPYVMFGLKVLFWPVTLFTMGVTAGLKRFFRIDITSAKSQARIAVLLSPIFWIPDLFVGTLIKGLRGMGAKISEEFEKGFHKWISMLWVTTLMTTVGPIVWGGLLAVAWTPAVKFFAVIFKWFDASLGVPWKDIFNGIYQYTGGAGAKEFFWGAGDKIGIFQAGWQGFAQGMKTFGNALVNPATWAPLGVLAGAIKESVVILSMKIMAIVGVPLAVARGWNEPLAVETRASKGVFPAGIMASLYAGVRSILPFKTKQEIKPADMNMPVISPQQPTTTPPNTGATGNSSNTSNQTSTQAPTGNTPGNPLSAQGTQVNNTSNDNNPFKVSFGAGRGRNKK